MLTRPASGRSSPPTQLSNVVFPEPERPVTATMLPAAATRSTPRSARTSSAPVRNERDNPSTTTIASSVLTVLTLVTSVSRAGPRRSRRRVGRATRRCGRPRARAGRVAPSAAQLVKSCGSCSLPTRSSTAYSCAMTCSSPCSDCSVRRSTSLDVRPSRMPMVRWTCSETLGSWVTTTPVTPISLLAVCSAANTSAEVAVSSSPVGSSANRTSGSLARATAIATRCCSPPDIWAGRRSRQCPTPSTPSSSSTRCSRPCRGRRAKVTGISTFSAAVRYGNRLRAVCCQTNPTTLRR